MVGWRILRFLIGSTNFFYSNRRVAKRRHAIVPEFASARFSRIHYVRFAFFSVISHLKNVPEKEKYVYAFIFLVKGLPLENFSGLLKEFGDRKEIRPVSAFGKLKRFKGLSFAELNRPNRSS